MDRSAHASIVNHAEKEEWRGKGGGGEEEKRERVREIDGKDRRQRKQLPCPHLSLAKERCRGKKGARHNLLWACLVC